MPEAQRPFLPAAGHDWLLPLYDPLLRLLGADRIRATLIDAARPQPGDRLLDLGCGTGSLAIQLVALCPQIGVCGVDPDPKALARARRKSLRAGAEIEWREGFADALPYPDASFDGVVSSLVFHHLPPAAVAAAVREVHRVLRSGGRLSVLDFGPEDHGLHGLGARFASHTPANAEDVVELCATLEETGWVDVEEVPASRSLLGEFVLTTGRVPLQAA